jgi:hypothetical protein
MRFWPMLTEVHPFQNVVDGRSSRPVASVTAHSVCILGDAGTTALGCAYFDGWPLLCRIGDAGATALGSALRVNRTLRTLRFDGNAIGVPGLKAVKAALASNKKLVDVPFLDGDMQVPQRLWCPVRMRDNDTTGPSLHPERANDSSMCLF